MRFIDFSRQRADQMQKEQIELEHKFLNGRLTERQFVRESKRAEKTCVQDLHRFRE